MINNNDIANIIRNLQFEQLDSFIQTSKDQGMVTMNMYIDALYKHNIITKEVAKNRKRTATTKSVYY